VRPSTDPRLERLLGLAVHDGASPVGLVLEARLGEGGMGVAFLARATEGVRSPWLAANEQCVVKVLLPEVVIGDPELAALSFKKEVVALARLREKVPPCPYVVRWFDAGEFLVTLADGTEIGLPWCAMELVDGRPLGTTLEDRLSRAPEPLEPARAVALVEGIARGLAAVHAVGLVHRDLKPSNVLVCGVPPHELAKLGDFGVARAAGLGETFDVTVGTTGYCAPEQMEGRRPGGGDGIGPWSDVFALGAIVYEIFARAPMFEANNAMQYAGRIIARNWTRLATRSDLGAAYRSSASRALLERLDVVLDRATSPRSPGGGVLGMDLPVPLRHASVEALLDDLDPILEGLRRLGSVAAPSILRREATSSFTFEVGLPSPAPIVCAAVRSDGAALASTGSELVFYDGVRWVPMPARPGDAMAVAILNPGAGTFVVVRGDGDVEVLPGGRTPYAFRLPFGVRAAPAIVGDPEDEAYLVVHAAHGEALVMRLQRRVGVVHARLGAGRPTSAIGVGEGLVVGLEDAGAGRAVSVDRRGRVTPLTLDGRSIHDLAVDAAGRLVVTGHEVERVAALPDGRVFGFGAGTVRERGADGAFALLHREPSLVDQPLRAAIATGARLYLVHGDGRLLRGIG